MGEEEKGFHCLCFRVVFADSFLIYFCIFSDLLFFYSSPTSNLQDLWGWDPRGQAASFGHPSNQAESQPACPHSGDQELREAHQGFKETTAGLGITSFR